MLFLRQNSSSEVKTKKKHTQEKRRLSPSKVETLHVKWMTLLHVTLSFTFFNCSPALWVASKHVLSLPQNIVYSGHLPDYWGPGRRSLWLFLLSLSLSLAFPDNCLAPRSVTGGVEREANHLIHEMRDCCLRKVCLKYHRLQGKKLPIISICSPWFSWRKLGETHSLSVSLPLSLSLATSLCETFCYLITGNTCCSNYPTVRAACHEKAHSLSLSPSPSRCEMWYISIVQLLHVQVYYTAWEGLEKS